MRGAVGIAVCGVAFLRPMIATTNIYYLLSIFVYSLLCTIDLYAGLIILPQPITATLNCFFVPQPAAFSFFMATLYYVKNAGATPKVAKILSFLTIFRKRAVESFFADVAAVQREGEEGRGGIFRF